ncbi:MAG: hypothetical protein ACI35W_04125 [Anaeroplasmataceae bacterium]
MNNIFLLNTITKTLLIILAVVVVLFTIVYFVSRILYVNNIKKKNNKAKIIEELFKEALPLVEVGMTKQDVKALFKDITPEMETTKILSYSYLFIDNDSNKKGERCEIFFEDGVVYEVKCFEVTKSK